MDIQALIFHPARPSKASSGQAVGALQKAGDMLLRILGVILIFNVLP
jgi:hypothetical protein